MSVIVLRVGETAVDLTGWGLVCAWFVAWWASS